MSEDSCFLSAVELADRIRSGDLSPVEAVEAYLERIEARNEYTNAYVTVIEERARDRAREVEQALADADHGGDDGDEPVGPLSGVPVAIKDLTDVAGVRTTYGSPFFADNVAETNHAVVDRLEDAGAIVLGKTNTPEFGYKGTTDNPLFGATSTPFDPERTSGGSSGGSAAAVADGLAAFAQGSDGGGSIRIPAACCGVYGFKPSFGRVPRESRPDGFGHHTPFTYVGPITRTVEDAALALDVVAGPHPADPFSLPGDGSDVDYRAATERPVDDLSVAYSPDLSMYPVDPGVRGEVEETVDAVEEAGASVEPVDFAEETGLSRSWEELDDAFASMWMASFAAMAERLKEERGIDYLGADREEASPGLPTLMEQGEVMDAASYVRVNEVRTEFYDGLGALLEDYDALVTPTLSVVPPGKHGPGPEEVDGQPIDRYTGWLLTWPFNMVPHPVASVPAGLVDGLPVGAQVVGRRFADEDVLAISAAIERVRPWHDAYEAFR